MFSIKTCLITLIRNGSLRNLGVTTVLRARPATSPDGRPASSFTTDGTVRLSLRPTRSALYAALCNASAAGDGFNCSLRSEVVLDVTLACDGVEVPEAGRISQRRGGLKSRPFSLASSGQPNRVRINR